MQRIIRHMEFDPHLVTQTFVDTTQQSTATGQINAVFYDIGNSGGVCSNALRTAASIFEIDLSKQCAISW